MVCLKKKETYNEIIQKISFISMNVLSKDIRKITDGQITIQIQNIYNKTEENIKKIFKSKILQEEEESSSYLRIK